MSLSFLIPVLIFAGGWDYYIHKAHTNTNEISEENHPGALALIDDNLNEEQLNSSDVPFLPDLLDVKADLPESYNDGCHQEVTKSDVIECAYGNTENPKYTIALVGGSHSAHWLPALRIIAEEKDIQLLNYTKSGCRFTTELNYSQNEVSLKSCEKWNEELIGVLLEIKPDLVFTTANATEQEGVPQGYIDKWEFLNENEITVFAIRDNPRFPIDIPTCIEVNGEFSLECTIKRSSVIPNDLWNDTDIPQNVYYADFTDYFCEEETCKPIVGNVLVYRDHHHITATYSKTLAPILSDEIMKAIDNQ